MKIGILNIQGDVSEHFAMIRKLPKKYGAVPVNVKTINDLDGLSGLIIPGGESTVIYMLLKRSGMYDKIIEMANSGLHIMGTCAGAILISKDTGDERVHGMGIMDITIQRNAYGRQINSFIKQIDINGIGNFNAVFIRAPEIEFTGKAQVLSSLGNKPVFAV
ncbi:pyridoxal 5'-phosphate synthase glutaminase subunit PdxT, partial [Ferroplasma sp.]|uniref:pyridoxal 5'-phosphate synthase glutaminase subunit PdxT n=1 Tax=Ferroplasma sp. TaxID=2591003 RepID=UPI00307F8F05